MAVVNGYCTLDELREWGGSTATASGANLERAITAASRAIDQTCQRTFWKTSAGVSRDFVVCDQKLVTFGAFNDLAAVTAVATDAAGDGTFETVWSASDYELLPVNASAAPEPKPWTHLRAVASRLFPYPTGSGKAARVRVTGTWGWPAVPADINQACLLLAARIYRRKDSPDGVTGWQDIGMMRVGRSDPDVSTLLDPYYLYSVLVA